MKIVCEACQAKYSISDDKVRGKAFKIRCKKCSHIIVVRSTAASMPVAEGSASGPLPVKDGSGLQDQAPSSSENAWHIVVEGEQVGPLSASDIRARLSRGEINGETFIWREGLADWQKVATVSEFAGAGASEEAPFPVQPPTTVYPPGTAESAFAASPGAGENDVFAAPTMVSSSPSADLFASSVSAAPEPAASPSFSFGSVAPSHDPGAGIRVHGNGAAGGLTGQRHENSVLFSLSNLEALAAPSSAPSSLAPRPGLSNTGGSEGSGLIDIRSMAQMTLGAQNEPRVSSDLPTFGAPQFSPVAPVLLPLGPSSGPSKWVFALIAVGLLFTLVVGGAAFMLLRKPNAPAPSTGTPVATNTPPTPAPTATPPAPPPAAHPPAPPVTPPAPVNEVLPPRDQKSAPTASKGPAKKGKPTKGPHGTDVAMGSGPGTAPAAATTKPEPAEKSKPKDKLDELLDGALGTKPKPAARPVEDEAPRAKPAAVSSSAPPLDKGDIVRAMQGIQPKVKGCFDQYKVPGTAMVTFHLDGAGRVKAAAVGGKFAGTPTGTCLESAAKAAKLPATSTATFQYPFLLH